MHTLYYVKEHVHEQEKYEQEIWKWDENGKYTFTGQYETRTRSILVMSYWKPYGIAKLVNTFCYSRGYPYWYIPTFTVFNREEVRDDLGLRVLPDAIERAWLNLPWPDNPYFRDYRGRHWGPGRNRKPTWRMMELRKDDDCLDQGVNPRIKRHNRIVNKRDHNKKVGNNWKRYRSTQYKGCVM